MIKKPRSEQKVFETSAGRLRTALHQYADRPSKRYTATLSLVVDVDGLPDSYGTTTERQLRDWIHNGLVGALRSLPPAGYPRELATWALDDLELGRGVRPIPGTVDESYVRASFKFAASRPSLLPSLDQAVDAVRFALALGGSNTHAALAQGPGLIVSWFQTTYGAVRSRALDAGDEAEAARIAENVLTHVGREAASAALADVKWADRLRLLEAEFAEAFKVSLPLALGEQIAEIAARGGPFASGVCREHADRIAELVSAHLDRLGAEDHLPSRSGFGFHEKPVRIVTEAEAAVALGVFLRGVV